MKNVQEKVLHFAELKETADQHSKFIEDCHQKQEDLVIIIKGYQKKCEASETNLEEAYKKIQSIQADLHDSQLQAEILQKQLQDFQEQKQASSSKIETESYTNPSQPISSTSTDRINPDVIIKYVKEDRRRFSRRLNICVRGFPTSNDDKSAFLDLCQNVLELDPALIDESIVSLIRVGPINYLKPRVMIIKLNNQDTRKLILRNAHKLKYYSSTIESSVYLSADLSRAQLLINKAFRAKKLGRISEEFADLAKSETERRHESSRSMTPPNITASGNTNQSPNDLQLVNDSSLAE